MKIFADKRDYNLDYFVGKDAWVKVLRSWDIDPVYMRVLRVDEALLNGYTSYVVNWVDAYDVDNSKNVFGDWSDQRIIDFILEESTYFFDDCNIVEPLQVLSTDEIISILLENHRCGGDDFDGYSDGFVEDDYNEDL